MKLDSSKGAIDPVCIGKINTSNPKNQIYQAYKAKVKSVQENKAEEMFKDRTFGDEYEAVKLTTDTLKLVFSFASACTVFVALKWALEPLLGSWASIGVALFVCTALEALKSFVWSKLSKSTLKYKTYPLPLLVAAIVFNLSSVGGSVFGAYQLPSNEQEFNSNNIALINIDSIGANYSKKIDQASAIISTQTKELSKTTSNSTKRTISANIAQSEQKATLLLKHKSRDIQAAQDKNNSLIKEAQEANKKQTLKARENLQSKRTNCMLVAALFELGLLLCLVFGSYYLFRVEIDKTGGFENQEQTDSPQTQNNTQQAGASNTQPHKAPVPQNQARTIGFKQGHTDHQKIDTLHNVSDTLHNVSKNQDATGVPNGFCENPKCNKEFTRKSVLKKHCSSKCRRKKSYDKLNKKPN